jgi:hypothetical protein
MNVELTQANLDTYNKRLLKKHNSLTYTLNEKIKNYSDSMYSPNQKIC